MYIRLRASAALALPLILCLAVGLVLGSLLSGCATSPERPVPLAAQVAVQYATLKVIENNPAHAPRIAEIARNIESSANGDASATVALLDAAVRAQIRWEKLTPADRMLVETLLLALRDELTARLGGGVLDPKQRLIVAQVAGWIEAAALTAPAP